MSELSLRSSVRTHAALLVVQASFAVGAVEGKLAMRAVEAGGGGVDPLALAMARMLGAAIFFQCVGRGARLLQPMAPRDHLRGLGLSVLGIVLNQALYLVGLRLTTAFAAALLGATIPVFTAALAVAMRLERASARTAAGLVLAFAGVAWLVGVRSADVGAIVIAANCFAYSLYIVLSKRMVERVGAMTLVTWLFTWGALLFAPIGAAPLIAGAAAWGARAWILVGLVLAVPTIVAYSANAWALGRSSPTLVTIYINLQPVLAAVLQWAQLGEPLSARAIVAALLILCGVALVAARTRPTSDSAPPRVIGA